MKIIHTDHQIDKWMQKRKVLPPDLHNFIWEHKKLYVWGDDDNKYRIIIRDEYRRKPSFSVVLLVYPFDTNQEVRLRRYNSPHGKHTNHLEGSAVYQYHIHKATEKYQRSGDDIDHYAEETNRFSDIRGALQCLIEDGNFQEVS